MKILLISPNHNRIVLPEYMKAIQEGVGHLPPLGLLSIAAYIKAHSNYEVQVIDALLDKLTLEELGEEIKNSNPDVVGIYAISYSLPDVLDTSRMASSINPEVKIVVGGPHTSIFPEETRAFPEFHYVVAGEGEVPFFNLLKYLETADKSLLPIDGVMGREPELDRISKPYVHEDLDSLPYPARQLTPWKRYASVVSKQSCSTTIMGSRGCPYHCTFCYTAGGKSYRPRSVPHLMEEIRECIAMGIREFFFFDETFTIDRLRVIDFCRCIVDEGIEIYWDVRCRVDLVDPEMLGWMKKAGCQRIQFGVESGSERVLLHMQKGFTREQAEKAVRWTKEAGISTYADFMIGNPGETLEEIEETIRFAGRLDPDFVHYSITMPLPRTKLYEEALEKGILEKDYWQEFAKNPTEDFKVPYWEENFTADELESLLKKAYHSFYLRPGYMLKSLGKLGSLDELKRKAQAGLNLFKLK